MREYESLIGQRFGMLVVREALPAKNGHRYWLCDCDCGKTSNVTTGNLKSGHITSCGCLKCPDLTGQTFGKLTVIRKSEERITRGSKERVAWECRCECGNVVLRTSESLLEDKDRMCSDCSHLNSADKAFQAAGFVGSTQVTKLKEMKMLSTNTSGCRGVYWHKKQQKWVARLKFQGKLMTFGSFSKFEDAVKARQRAEEEIYGTFIDSLSGNDAVK